MRRLLLAIGFALSLCAGAQAQPAIIGPANAIVCNQSAQVAIGVSGQTRIVVGAPGKVIVICGWHITNSAAAGTFQLSSGTGSNCGTGNATLSPAFTVTSTAPATDHQNFAFMQVPTVAPLQTAAQNDLCINPSVATIAALVYFAQF